MLNGISHITIAVTDLTESFTFYSELLGMRPHARWDSGAYLSLNGLWFCLSCDLVKPSSDYSHVAFDVLEESFSHAKSKLLEAGVYQWKKNTSEGESFYFLDPNGHKLELHVGNLHDRIESLKKAPYKGLQLF